MPQDTPLQDLILGYCRQVGGLVEDPAYGVHEVLLPDEVAARWEIDPHQKFIFSAGDGNSSIEDKPGSGEDKPTLLHYGHPLVETVVEELRRQPANGLFFINDVRLEKPGLFTVIEKTLIFPNAKLFSVRGAMERRRVYHYVRFNFKASLIADEKRELILPVWMHLQGGYAVKGDKIQGLVALDVENQFPNLDPAEPFWLPRPPANLLSEEVLRPLLERARQAAYHELGGTLESLQARLKRFLELDRARLQQYYDDLKKNAQKRLQKADEARRPALEAKLAAIEAEHQSKLEDVEQKYHLRVELELINFAVIAQPKLDLPVEVKKRTATIKRQVVWDVLRHAVEPPACDVCGQPGETLQLCEQGHLAHADCLAPQCVECKRTFCQICAEKVSLCVVCDRPVCGYSLVRCSACQRVTCQEHMNLCHAADGEPQRVQFTQEPAAAPEKATPDVAGPSPSQAIEPTGGGKSRKKKETPRGKKASQKGTPVKKARPSGPVGDYIEIYSEPGRALVSAYVMVRRREIALRTWELGDEGIAVHCKCEDWFCRNNGIVYRPAHEDQLEQQLMFYIREFMKEHHVPRNKVRFYRIRMGEAYEARKLILTGKWKNPEVLETARSGFDKLARS